MLVCLPGIYDGRKKNGTYVFFFPSQNHRISPEIKPNKPSIVRVSMAVPMTVSPRNSAAASGISLSGSTCDVGRPDHPRRIWKLEIMAKQTVCYRKSPSLYK